jgi:hypothetical protein
MQLRARHRFPATRDRTVAAMVDPAFVTQLVALPDVGTVEVVDHGSDDRDRWISARFTYDGSLDPIAARVLGSRHPSWVQTYRMPVNGATGRLDIVPEHHSGLLDCHAEVSLRQVDDATERLIDGSLTVPVPLLGGRAERALTPAILARIDLEADLLVAWLTKP